mmetsp:Transcript_19145/g.33585  ORF Transcript_19145/g.33585 Transcript_19145/m.33585 type:complete len:113 (-) Transcript_19145:491-829(-)
MINVKKGNTVRDLRGGEETGEAASSLISVRTVTVRFPPLPRPGHRHAPLPPGTAGTTPQPSGAADGVCFAGRSQLGGRLGALLPLMAMLLRTGAQRQGPPKIILNTTARADH